MNRKKVWFLVFGVALGGCRSAQNPPPVPLDVPTAVPRLNMDRRLTMLFPDSAVRKLAVPDAGEFYEATRGDKIVGRAALIPVQGADKKALQILLVVAPNGKIARIAAGLPGSAGVTRSISALNEFLQQFRGKNEVELAKYQLHKGVEAPLAKAVVDELRRALTSLKNATKL